ncbi:MAG: putative ABC transporter ATP-binding protein YejF [Anaerolineae bacterium]|nr:putative ABC transporter ATP-binding protein YejF [Anaerolineae bacterium]
MQFCDPATLQFCYCEMTDQSLLKIENLYAAYPSADGPLPTLHDISLELGTGQALGIIGETGSGKTTLARCLMGLLPPEHVRGSIRLAGQELVGLDESEWRGLRWRRVAMAFQGVGGGFNPIYTIGQQISEPMETHLGLSGKAAKEKARSLLARVGLALDRFNFHPHQLSGGEKQRAMIAMALACDPELLIVDEPTTGLDVSTQAHVLNLLARLRAELRFTLIVISHNLVDITRLTDQTAVLYGGRLMELNVTPGLVDDPLHPYTWGLLNAYPTMTTTKDLRGIRGTPPVPGMVIRGCPFHPRCSQAIPDCATQVPPLLPVGRNGHRLACIRDGLVTLLEAKGLTKTYAGRNRNLLSRHEQVTAVRDVSLTVRAGEVVAIVGQTGSGKTTLGKMIVGMIKPDAGEVIFEGKPLGQLKGDALQQTQRHIQMIFQEPFEAVSPRLTVGEIVREPLDIQQIGRPAEREAEVDVALRAVNLPNTPEFKARYVHQLSGGQAQRVVIARSLILSPQLIIADEPVSMLDASEQAKVLNLLKHLQNERGIALLLITHDLALVRKVADRIIVLQHGQVVEQGPSHQIISNPQHPHTRALIESSPAL